MAKHGAISVRFWGVRGSTPCPGPRTLHYGGNTACVEVRCGGHRIVLDAGTGIHAMGRSLAAGDRMDADILFSHTHMDHITGVPFFSGFFAAENRFRLWCGNLLPERSLKSVLCSLMKAPLFPVPPDVFRADIAYRDFRAGETLALAGGVSVRTAPLTHPNGATGYRIEHGGKAVCYVTDTEHEPGTLDDQVLALIEGADVVIYDSHFTDATFDAFRGWGHSTWEQGVRLCEAAGAGMLVTFHHAPESDDAALDAIAIAAAKRRPGTLVAREGMILTP